MGRIKPAQSVKTSNPKEKAKRKMSPLAHRRRRKTRLYNSFKNKLKKILPAVFKKDVGRGDYVFKLFCDIIRINNLIDTTDDMTCIEFIVTEQRIMHAMYNFFSIRRHTLTNDGISTTARSLGSYMPLYQELFVEISELGSGAFGKVYKTRHLYDKMDYAVKQISMKAKNVKKIVQSLEEAKTLAKLNHTNIVSYKHAWIEPSTTHLSQSPSSSGPWTESQSDVAFLNTLTKDIQFMNIISGPNTYCEEDECDEESLNNESEPIVILYIQMSLCEKNLEQWMYEREGYSSQTDLEKIATQILSGLNYIHKLHVVHHDINPKNIFISMRSNENHVQIGDFGLACLSHKVQHSQIIGTRRYMAPEQMNKQCNSKSDIYSFGIVLFELLYPMRTVSESIKEVENLKKGNIPEDVINLYPHWVSILKKTVRENPVLRPSAEELLEFVSNDKDTQIIKLQSQIDSLKDENERLIDENVSLQKKIKKMDELFQSPYSTIEDLDIWTIPETT